MDFGQPNVEIGQKMANGQLLFLALDQYYTKIVAFELCTYIYTYICMYVHMHLHVYTSDTHTYVQCTYTFTIGFHRLIFTADMLG